MTDKEKELQAEAIGYYREQIAELKKENTRLRNENLDIINKYTRFAETDRKTIADLEAEVKEWKDKADLWCKTANLKDHNIMINKELEKENAELQHKVDTLQGFLDRDVEFDNLQKENAELKCECRRCVYSDCPCILSDYGKDRNGICDHFKDVFDENAELKDDNKVMADNYSKMEQKFYNNLTKAKEIIREVMNWYWETDICSDSIPPELRQKAEQFLKETGK